MTTLIEPGKVKKEESTLSSRTTRRLIAVDALRGFDMFWIIGGSYLVTGLAKAVGGPLNAITPQFEHVAWEGLHFEDLIWPLFMFLVGVSIPLSVSKRKASGATNRSLYAHAFYRVAILFFLGTIVQGGLLKWDLSQLHPFYSVLHGIAAGYLIAFIVVMQLRPRMQTLIVPVFLVLYWALLELIPVPGFGAGVLTSEGNAAIWIDQLIQGRFHFGNNTWFLSYLGFASSVLLGVSAGRLLMSDYSEKIKVIALASAGMLCIGIGLLWSLAFPVIKLLWTSSFVLIGGGYSFLMLALFHWIIEVKGFRRWTYFFRVIGVNSIFAYLAYDLIPFGQIGNVFVGDLLPHIKPWSNFVYFLAGFTILWLILYWMYRTKSFLKI